MRNYKVILTLIILTLFSFAVLFILYSSSSRSEAYNSKRSRFEPIEKRSFYQGTFITAELPDGWSIKEFEDNEGMSVSASGNYNGFTGFKIYKSDKLIFTFGGVDGVGGIGICNPIYKFNDTDDKYIDTKIQEVQDPIFAKDEGLSTPNIINLSEQNFTSVKLFDRSGRRVEDKIYWDKDNDDTTFDPLCGIGTMLLTFEGIHYQYSEDYQAKTYKVTIEKNIEELDLVKLDQIINSIKKI